jgi:hypothetical protein
MFFKGSFGEKQLHVSFICKNVKGEQDVKCGTLNFSAKPTPAYGPEDAGKNYSQVI